MKVFDRPRPESKLITLEEPGEFDSTDSSHDPESPLGPCPSSADESFDTEPEPFDPDRAALRTLHIPRHLYEFKRLDDFTTYCLWQGEYRAVRPQLDVPVQGDPLEQENRSPTPDFWRPHRVAVVDNLVAAGLPAGLDSLVDYTGDEFVYKLRDVLYCLGLAVDGHAVELLKRLLCFEVGDCSGHLVRDGIKLRHIDWRHFEVLSRSYTGLCELCFGLGVLSCVERSKLERNIRAFKNDTHEYPNLPRVPEFRGDLEAWQENVE